MADEWLVIVLLMIRQVLAWFGPLSYDSPSPGGVGLSLHDYSLHW